MPILSTAAKYDETPYTRFYKKKKEAAHQDAPLFLLCFYDLLRDGRGGIRTLDTLAGITVFETVPFNRSGTLP
jgi:hypothetical protein